MKQYIKLKNNWCKKLKLKIKIKKEKEGYAYVDKRIDIDNIVSLT
jgi:hypothetical protein